MKHFFVRLFYNIGLKKLSFEIDPLYAYIYADTKITQAYAKEVQKFVGNTKHKDR